MNKRFIGLDKRLLLAAALAIGAALLAFSLTQSAGYYAVDRYLEEEAFQERAENALYANLQSLIDAKGVRAGDAQIVDELLKDTDVFAMILIRDGVVVYDSSGQIVGIPAADFFFEESEMRRLYFADGEAQAVAYSDPSLKYYLWVYTLSWAAAAIAFILLFTLLIRRRIRYILALEREMRILEGGDLRHEAPIVGADELSLLAASINEMRLSVLERQEAQERAETAGRNLVATMSHDLRTPLTALIGYLELISRGKYNGEAQRAHFVDSALEKAVRIKRMSDDLFDYALGMLGDERNMEMEIIDMRLFLRQLVADEQFDLEKAGLTLAWTDGGEGFVRAAPERLLRVFDNLFSNARKYASPQGPIRLSWTREEQNFRVDMRSRIRANAPRGTGLGLTSCDMILRAMGGSFGAEKRDGMFCATFRLPLCEQNTKINNSKEDNLSQRS